MPRPQPIIVPGPSGMGGSMRESHFELIPKELGNAILGELLGAWDRKRQGSAARELFKSDPNLAGKIGGMSDSQIAYNSQELNQIFKGDTERQQMTDALNGLFKSLGGGAASDGNQAPGPAGAPAGGGQAQTKGPFGNFDLKNLAAMAAVDPQGVITSLTKQMMPLTRQEQVNLEKSEGELAHNQKMYPLEEEKAGVDLKAKGMDVAAKERENASQNVFQQLIVGNYQANQQKDLEGKLTPSDAERWKNWQKPESLSTEQLYDRALNGKGDQQAKAKLVLSTMLADKVKVAEIEGEAKARSFAGYREYAALDTANGNAPIYLSADEIRKANQSAPGRFIPSGPGEKALTKTGLIEDIRGTISNTRNSMNNLKTPFNAEQIAQLQIVMGASHPNSALQGVIKGKVGQTLTPDQIDYLTDLSQLAENAMAMRSVLGAGQGSEDLRSAILATVPGPGTPSKKFGTAQLDKFEQTINRLERFVPQVGGAKPKGKIQTEQKGAAPAGKTKSGRDYYIWSDGQAHYSPEK